MKKEIEKRRTFAIVSHPDAGKTTMTEKFLWYGNVIREAGHVRAKANRSHTTSDWMKIEQQRGISVSSSVINFPFAGCQFNLLDTPGHEDFCEDTYRALTAVDSALVLIDSVNGVEKQTIKLMEVCRMRQTPIITFVNKMDLDGKDAIDLLDEIEDILQIKCSPFTLPIGYGKLFKGVFSIPDNTLHTYSKEGVGQEVIQLTGIEDPELDQRFDDSDLKELRDRYNLVTGVMEKFDPKAYLKGEMCPVFFGSAISNFGVRQLLDTFADIAPGPLPRATEGEEVSPYSEDFSGFIFKIQANMDPKHRDRTAFMRICSGMFERGAKVYHCRSGRQIKLAAPTSFTAQSKTVVDQAYAGDIVGINDPGLFNIGDTLSAGKTIRFLGIPDFAPEFFGRVVLKDPLKSKQMFKGLEQLSEEGATQLFIPVRSPVPVIGVVGELQFDVLKFRIESEYGARVDLEKMPVYQARWVMAKVSADSELFEKENIHDCVRDKHGNLVCLFPNEYKLNLAQKNYPNISFERTFEG
jgi:peptide chain release factor 3